MDYMKAEYDWAWVFCNLNCATRRIISSYMKVSSIDTAGGTMSETTEWPDPPTAPPQ